MLKDAVFKTTTTNKTKTKKQPMNQKNLWSSGGLDFIFKTKY